MNHSKNIRSRKAPNKLSQYAFTVLELMVATTILFLLTGLLLQLFSQASRIWVTEGRRLNKERDVRLVFSEMNRSISMARTSRDAQPIAFHGTSNSIYCMVPVDGVINAVSELSMVGYMFTNGALYYGIRSPTYDNYTNNLWNPRSDITWIHTNLYSIANILIESVQYANMKYYSSNGTEHVFWSSTNASDSATYQQLPSVIEVSFVISNRNDTTAYPMTNRMVLYLQNAP